MTFVGQGLDDTQHSALVTAFADSGYAAISTTVLHGRTVLRLCTINPLTIELDLVETLRSRLRPGNAS